MDWQELSMSYVCRALLGLVALGTAIDLVARSAYALGMRAWWHFTGSVPICLSDSLAQRVAAEFAEKMMAHQDVPEDDKPDAIRAQALLIHTALVSYCYRLGASR
jgi:hypothetical protein